ncbi:MAG: Sfum_1244 family protein [Candidatus Methylomirabilia bacterium]
MASTIDVGAVAAQVAHNCLVADAHRWGHFSLCGLLLRLRELYKREADLEPWARVETASVLPWVGEREAAWAPLEDAELTPFAVGGTPLDPLDEDGANRLLIPAGWIYVAGQGPGGHPLFVLGEILERRELRDGIELFVVGRELVHDLVPVPAMCRPGRIVARRSAVRGHLWATLEEAAGAREAGAAQEAVAEAGGTLAALVADPEKHAALLEELTEHQLAAAIAHELGELAEDRRRRGAWEALLLRSRGTRAEMPARALKDALADAGDGGLIQSLIARRDRVGLALRAAAGPWLLRKVLPEARAIWDTARAGRWGEAEALRRSAAARLELRLDALFRLFDGDPPHAEAARRAEQFEKELTGGV